ncbi:hypothetical protein [Escherichia phage CR01]|nr:hypothetical protein [Escherichia phage CR01]
MARDLLLATTKLVLDLRNLISLTDGQISLYLGCEMGSL